MGSPVEEVDVEEPLDSFEVEEVGDPAEELSFEVGSAISVVVATCAAAVVVLVVVVVVCLNAESVVVWEQKLA